MDKQIRMSASEVDLYKHIYHSNKLDHNDIPLTEAGLQSMNNLLGEIEKIKPTYPNKRWEFWFSVPRGTLKQYIKFNKYYDSGDCSEEKFQKGMEAEFPRKRVWFKIGVINENGYVVIFLDDTVLVRRSPDMKGDFFPDARLDRILEFLSQTVANTVEKLEQGMYNDYVKKELPHENRKGFINRALYWRIVPKSKRNDRDGLKGKEIDKLIKHVKNGNDLFATKASERYERMTSGKYYEVCSYCYAAAGYKELDGKTPKEMFKRYGDERDGGMSLLDENSPEDFDKSSLIFDAIVLSIVFSCCCFLFDGSAFCSFSVFVKIFKKTLLLESNVVVIRFTDFIFVFVGVIFNLSFFSFSRCFIYVFNRLGRKHNCFVEIEYQNKTAFRLCESA